MPVWFISEDPIKKGGVGGGGMGSAPLAFRDFRVKNNLGSQATITITTPALTLEGDLMFAFLAIHAATSDLRMFPDDPTDGWALLDAGRNEQGLDHQYNVFWKLADGSDASGGASYQWNSRDSRDLIDRADEMDGYIAAFSSVQDPATDQDFIYLWEGSKTTGAATDILMADIEFGDDLALDGDGLLVCMVLNDNSVTTITTPGEMSEHINDDGDTFHRMVLATEDISAASGSIGPKRFIQSAGVDFIGLAFILKPRVTDGRFESLYDYPKIADVADRFLAVTANGQRITATPPSGTQIDDLLILILSRRPSSDSGTTVIDATPADQGWTTVYDRNVVNDSALAIWWKRATAEDASTAPDEVLMDWASVGSQTPTAIIYRITGITYDANEQFIGFLGNNAVPNTEPWIEPGYSTPFDDCLIFKILSHQTAHQIRRDIAPRGLGKLVEHLTPSVSNTAGTVVMVEGAPFRGFHPGGKEVLPSVSAGSSNYDFATFYIAKNPVEIDIGDTFGFRGVRGELQLHSLIKVALYTPTDTREGDLLIAAIATHSGVTNFGVFPTDKLAGWERLDRQVRSQLQYTMYWKIADGKDANGAARHLFQIRDSVDDVDQRDQTVGMMAAFSGVQEPATDLDFFYRYDTGDLNDTSTDALVADIDFSEAPEGDGLLVVYMVNETQTITTPGEMTEHLNDENSLMTQCLATELVSPSTGSVGPKRFINGTSVVWIATAFILKPFDTGGRNNAIYNNYPKFPDFAGRTEFFFNNLPSVTATPPSGTTEDDLLILVLSREVAIESGGVVDTVSPTSQGWTELYDALDNFVGGLGIWWKRATAEDASTAPDEILLDWSGDSSSRDGNLIIFRISGITFDTADSFIGVLASSLEGSSFQIDDPVVTTPFDDCLLVRIWNGNGGYFNGAFQANGFGKMVLNSWQGSKTGISIAAEGAPFIGSYGGGQLYRVVAAPHQIVSLYIVKDAQPPPGEPAFEGFTVNNAGSVSSISLTTPSETLEGDFLIVFVAVHTGTQNFGVFPDDPTDGWTLLDRQRENLAGVDHHHNVFWKVADGSDAAGGASYQFNNRNSSNRTDVTDVTDAVMMVFSDIQEPATDVAFLYQWDEDVIGGNAVEPLVADMDFRAAPDGDGLLVCLFSNDTQATGAVTVPTGMSADINDRGGTHTLIVASETISPSTGSVGPKRFVQPSTVDWLCTSFILKPSGGVGERTAPLYSYPKIIDEQGRFFDFVLNAQSIIAIPPDGTEVGDLLIMFFGKDAGSNVGKATPDINPTSQGWNELYNENIINDQGAAIWWKLADEGDTGTDPNQTILGWASDGNQDANLFMYRVGGITLDTADSFIGLLGANNDQNQSIHVEPVVTTPFDNCLIFKLIVGEDSEYRRQDMEPRGAGNLVGIVHNGATANVSVTVMVEGAPFAGEYGGGKTAIDGTSDYVWIDIYIAKEAV